MPIVTNPGPGTVGGPMRSRREGQPTRVRLPDPELGVRDVVLIAANDQMDDLEWFIIEFLEHAAAAPGGQG